MPKITFVQADGSQSEVELSRGHQSVMEFALENGIGGIDADCGGSMSCATCHVYVKEDWYDKLPKKEMGEDDMLDQAYEPNSSSRLSCQIMVSDDLDGLSVYMPEKQV